MKFRATRYACVMWHALPIICPAETETLGMPIICSDEAENLGIKPGGLEITLSDTPIEGGHYVIMLPCDAVSLDGRYIDDSYSDNIRKMLAEAGIEGNSFYFKVDQ